MSTADRLICNQNVWVRFPQCPQTNSVVEESGLSRLLWEQKYAGSNPVYATNFKKNILPL